MRWLFRKIKYPVQITNSMPSDTTNSQTFCNYWSVHWEADEKHMQVVAERKSFVYVDESKLMAHLHHLEYQKSDSSNTKHDFSIDF